MPRFKATRIQLIKPIRLLATAALLIGAISSGGQVGAQGTSRSFPETGKTVSGKFLTYWEGHGGLAQQGFPISDEMQEQSATDGKMYTVQYFERAVFEAHPEKQAPYDVLLSLLGVFQYGEKYPEGAQSQRPSSDAGARTFAETGHMVGGKFLAYWEGHGGLAQQGFPISDEFTEKSDLDGKSYTVQYFERAVFELHPENAGTDSEVLLSQLGTFQYRARYSGEAGTPTPAVIPTVAATATTRPSQGILGSITPTGNMVVARACHSATLLANGTVLMVGGQQRSGEFTNTAEIYGPKTGQFTATGSMAGSRSCAEAVLLPSGKVLVVGGSADATRAELYDPATGAFSLTGAMTDSRYEPFQAILLPNGKVLLAGGYSNVLLTSAELYDPSTGTFTRTGSMHEGRANQTATLLLNGKVLMTGGGMAEPGSDMIVVASAEIYDPATGTFSLTGSMATARYKHGAAMLPDGRVVVVGGSDIRQLGGLIASAEIYDPTAGTFSPAGSLEEARYKIGDAVVGLPDGKVVVAGGGPVEVLDPATSTTYRAAGDMIFPRLFQSATLLPDNSVLIAGGYTIPGVSTSGVWIYRP